MNPADLARFPALAAQVLKELPDARGISRAPGRVNLIGEHTDYNGFPVLPLAIDRAAWIAWAPRERREITVRNLDPVAWPTEVIAVDALALRERSGTWVDYIVAGLRCAPSIRGMEIVVGSDVPPAAGLSSSAALVVASLLLVLPQRDPMELADIAARAERYVGTEAGGMDQAISLLARPGAALRIDFRPLRVAAVPIPENLCVLVAPSGIVAAKGGAAQAAYNQRVAECARAARELGAPAGGLLADVPGASRASRAAALKDPILAKRARFVFEEAERVDQAVRALERGEHQALGQLIDASHAGLRDLYEVSDPAVDQLVEELRAAGALGARIVGAGFGGCAVALCERADLERVRRAFPHELWVVQAGAPAVYCELS